MSSLSVIFESKERDNFYSTLFGFKYTGSSIPSVGKPQQRGVEQESDGRRERAESSESKKTTRG
jgi:hypothetical protein